MANTEKEVPSFQQCLGSARFLMKAEVWKKAKLEDVVLHSHTMAQNKAGCLQSCPLRLDRANSH